VCSHAHAYACKCVYVCVYVCTHRLVPVVSYVSMCACCFMCVDVCLSFHVCRCVPVVSCVSMCACRFMCVYVCLSFYVCACRFTCVYVCMKRQAQVEELTHAHIDTHKTRTWTHMKRQAQVEQLTLLVHSQQKQIKNLLESHDLGKRHFVGMTSGMYKRDLPSSKRALSFCKRVVSFHKNSSSLTPFKNVLSVGFYIIVKLS